MSEDISVYVDEVRIRDGRPNVEAVHFLRTDNSLYLVHVDIEETVYGLVFPKKSLKKGYIVDLALAGYFFRTPDEYAAALEKILVEVFGEVDDAETENYLVDRGAPLHKPAITKENDFLSKSEERAKFLQFNTISQLAVALPIEHFLRIITPPRKS